MHNRVTGYILEKNGVDLLTTSRILKFCGEIWIIRLGVFTLRLRVSVIRRSDYGYVKRTRRIQVYQPPHLMLFALMKRDDHCCPSSSASPSFLFLLFFCGGRERFLWRGKRPWRAFSTLYLPPHHSGKCVTYMLPSSFKHRGVRR